jgi:hypothetical protein
MRPHVLTFKKSLSFNDLVARVKAVMNAGCDMQLYGRYNMRSNRPIYVMLLLGSENEWQLYKSCASQSELKGTEVVAEIALLTVGDINVHETDVIIEETIANPIAMEQPSQEEWRGVTHRVSLGSELARTNSETLNLVVVTDDFDGNMFAENIDTEQYIEEDDDKARSESDAGNVQPSVHTGGEGNEANVPSSAITLCDALTSSRIDWSSYYTLVDDEGNLRVWEEVVKKGQLFESLDAVKFFF